MAPGPSPYSDVAQGSAKALPVPPGLQHSAHSLPCKDSLVLFLGVVLAWKLSQLSWFACLFSPALDGREPDFVLNSHPPNSDPVLRILSIPNKSQSSWESQPSGKMRFQNKELKHGISKSQYEDFWLFKTYPLLWWDCLTNLYILLPAL